jgi:hypothetical protein
MAVRISLIFPAIVALIVLVLAGSASGQTKHPLVGCYSPMGNQTIVLQVAENEGKIHMALGYEKTRNIFVEQTLAHEMSRRELIDKGGFKEEETEMFVSNIFMNKCGSCVAGVIEVKPGVNITSFESLASHEKGKTIYFAFMGIVAGWVDKVDCP